MRFSTIVLLLTSSLVVFASKQVVLSDVSQRNVPLGDKTLAEFDIILNTVMRRVKSHVHVASWEELRVVLQRDIQRDLEHAIPQTLSRQYPNVAEQLRKASNEARQSIAQAVANGALNLATDVPIFFNQKISKYYATASLDIVPLVVQLTRSDHDPITIEAKICQHLLQG
ncbi:hypothetical protein BDF22DRAFT_740862 [Syncephalis plumigaleata]|nr:hypothetical protein BDF22DRAFT_740862 [Syncephalis plumigaleata]